MIFPKILRIDNTMHRPGLVPPGNVSIRCLRHSIEPEASELLDLELQMLSITTPSQAFCKNSKYA